MSGTVIQWREFLELRLSFLFLLMRYDDYISLSLPTPLTPSLLSLVSLLSLLPLLSPLRSFHFHDAAAAGRPPRCTADRDKIWQCWLVRRDVLFEARRTRPSPTVPSVGPSIRPSVNVGFAIKRGIKKRVCRQELEWF